MRGFMGWNKEKDCKKGFSGRPGFSDAPVCLMEAKDWLFKANTVTELVFKLLIMFARYF